MTSKRQSTAHGVLCLQPHAVSSHVRIVMGPHEYHEQQLMQNPGQSPVFCSESSPLGTDSQGNYQQGGVHQGIMTIAVADRTARCQFMGSTGDGVG